MRTCVADGDGAPNLTDHPSPNTAPEVATKLYPHQLKALTFLLAREQELGGASQRQTSLWQERVNPLSHQASWINIVTQAEEFSKPFEAKGAILADDVRAIFGGVLSTHMLTSSSLDGSGENHYLSLPNCSDVPFGTRIC